MQIDEKNLAPKIAVIALTKGGCRTARRLAVALPQAELYLKAAAAEGQAADEREQHFSGRLADLLAQIYGQYSAFVLIMAAGIVFRSFAPYVQHKSVDPALVVVDEKGRFAISLLSGHLGGANRLTEQVAALLGAQPVITTATDINRLPAFDLLAQANACAIANLPELKYISGALVNGGQVAVGSVLSLRASGSEQLPPELVQCSPGQEQLARPLVLIDWHTPAAQADWPRAEHVLRLIPRCLILGAGCRRNTPAEQLLAAAEDFLAQNQIEPAALQALASVDLKKDEPGLQALAAHFGLPFQTFSGEQLGQLAEALPEEAKSAFVQSVAGTPSVAQAAALLAAGPGGRTLIPKTRYPGITFSLAYAPRVFQI